MNSVPQYRVAVFLLICLFSTAGANLSVSRAETPSQFVNKWMRTTLDLSDTQIVWSVDSETQDREGNTVDQFTLRETCNYRWPIEMSIETRAVAQGDRHDFARAASFDQLSKIDASGHQTESKLSVTYDRDLGDNQSLRGIVASQSQRAPHLLGLWLAEHPEVLTSAETSADGTVSLVLKPLHLRLTLASFRTPDNATHPVVSTIEYIDSDRNPLLWWVYEDFQQIGSTGHYTGRFRIQYSTREGSLYESLPSRIEEISLLERRTNKPTETGLIAPPEDASSSETGDGEQTQDVPQQRNRMRKTMQNAPNVLIGVGVLMIGVLGIRFFLRAKSGS